KVLSLNSDLCRVQLPDGRIGYLKRRDITSELGAIDNLVAEADLDLMLKPDFNSRFDMILANEDFEIIGKDKEFYLIETVSGKRGWIRASSNKKTFVSEDEMPLD
ncbi:MAG: SH3 domain-containing protein, partial [Cytophagia bacterium]|nr:SH3 domain-containing protein [Cytophagia bacterium]